MEESVQLIQQQQREVIRDLFVEFNEKFFVFYQMSSDNNQSKAVAILLNAVDEAISAFFADPDQGDVRALITSQRQLAEGVQQLVVTVARTRTEVTGASDESTLAQLPRRKRGTGPDATECSL
jgi:hypothetical protein